MWSMKKTKASISCMNRCIGIVGIYLMKKEILLLVEVLEDPVFITI